MSQQEQWINRTVIKSETSNRVYVVSQHATKHFCGCSCPGWKAHRKCKHLERLGLPCGEEPFEVEKDHGKKNGFLDGYKTYDASAGHGSKADWQQEFARKMGLDEARMELGLPADAGWDAIRQALRLAATESPASGSKRTRRIWTSSATSWRPRWSGSTANCSRASKPSEWRRTCPTGITLSQTGSPGLPTGSPPSPAAAPAGRRRRRAPRCGRSQRGRC